MNEDYITKLRTKYVKSMRLPNKNYIYEGFVNDYKKHDWISLLIMTNFEHY